MFASDVEIEIQVDEVVAHTDDSRCDHARGEIENSECGDEKCDE